MKITQITGKHLLNRIDYFERVLAEKPPYYAYVGDSEYAEQSVESENAHNDEMAEAIEKHIKYMKRVNLP